MRRERRKRMGDWMDLLFIDEKRMYTVETPSRRRSNDP
jgi:hypothetical protein